MIFADFQSAPIITGDVTLPLRWLPPATPFVDLPFRKHLVLQVVSERQIEMVFSKPGCCCIMNSYKSKGKAVRFLSGYNMKSEDERKKYDENAMCKAYGKRMIVMSLPFIVGIIIDTQYQGIGCLIAWVVWGVMFILLLVDRHKRER